MNIGYHEALLAAAVPKRVIKNQLPGKRDHYQDEEKRVQERKKSEKEVRDDILKQSLKSVVKSRKVGKKNFSFFFQNKVV